MQRLSDAGLHLGYLALQNRASPVFLSRKGLNWTSLDRPDSPTFSDHEMTNPKATSCP